MEAPGEGEQPLLENELESSAHPHVQGATVAPRGSGGVVSPLRGGGAEEHGMTEDRDVGAVVDVDKLLEAIGYGPFQWRLLALCASGYLAVCSELLVLTFIEDDLRKTAFSHKITRAQYASVVVCINVASFLGSYVIGYVADLRGRKVPFVASIAVAVVFGVLSAAAQSFWMFAVFRTGAGIGIGGLQVIDITMFTEFTTPATRGRYFTVVFVAGCMGVLFIAGVDLVPYSVLPSSPSHSSLFALARWRVMLLVAVFPLLVSWVCRCFFAVESPRYLLARHRIDETYRVLAHVAKMNGRGGLFRHTCPPEDDVDGGGGGGGGDDTSATRDSRSASALSNSNASTSTVPTPRRPVVLPRNHVVRRASIWIAGMVHATGLMLKSAPLRTVIVPLGFITFVQALVYWGLTLFLPDVYADAGIDPRLPLFLMVCMELPGCAFMSRLIDNPAFRRVGTLRVLYAASFVATLLSAVVQGGATLIILACAIYFFLIPVWCVLFIMTPEYFPTQHRGLAVAFFSVIQSLPGCFVPFLSASLAGSRRFYMGVWAAFLAVAGAAAWVGLRRSEEPGGGGEVWLGRGKPAGAESGSRQRAGFEEDDAAAMLRHQQQQQQEPGEDGDAGAGVHHRYRKAPV